MMLIQICYLLAVANWDFMTPQMNAENARSNVFLAQIIKIVKCALNKIVVHRGVFALQDISKIISLSA